MKCDCIEQVQKELRVKTGDDKAHIGVGFVTTKKVIDGGNRIGIDDFVIVPAFYRERKRDGSLKERESVHYEIRANYCPFCGIKAHDEENVING
jgi:hypothetical protein